MRVSSIACFAVAALGIALWDLKAKRSGVSVLDLLGGPFHERLPRSRRRMPSRRASRRVADAAAGWMGRGLHDVKVGFGKKGDAHLGYAHARDIDFVKALRDAIGPGSGRSWWISESRCIRMFRPPSVVCAQWAINTPRKHQFFGLLADMTGATTESWPPRRRTGGFDDGAS